MTTLADLVERVGRLTGELEIVRDLPLPEQPITPGNAGPLATSMLHTLQWLQARARAALQTQEPK